LVAHIKQIYDVRNHKNKVSLYSVVQIGENLAASMAAPVFPPMFHYHISLIPDPRYIILASDSGFK